MASCIGGLPYATGGVERVYTNLQGAVVRSSTCFNPDNMPRAGADCSSAQSYRNSTYYSKRFGAAFNVAAELGNHALRAGVWYEKLDRDFVRERYTLVDLSVGYRLPIGDRQSVEARLGVNNLFDERHIGGILDEFTQHYTVGSPNTVALTATVNF